MDALNTDALILEPILAAPPGPAASPLGGIDPLTALLFVSAALLIAWGLAKSRGHPLLSRAKRPHRPDPALANDLQELTARLASEMDAKAERLERLLREADVKLARMNVALDALDAARASPAPPPRPARAAAPTPAVPPLADDAAPAPRPVPPTAAPARTAAQGRQATAPRATGGLTVLEPDPLTRRVYDLADQGRTAHEIAQALDEQVGKVQLILALRGP